MVQRHELSFKTYRLRGPHEQISQHFYIVRLWTTAHPIGFLDSSN
jgi:hypothetical protein